MRCATPVPTPFATKDLPCGVENCKAEPWHHEDWLSHMQVGPKYDGAPAGTAAYHEARWARGGKEPAMPEFDFDEWHAEWWVWHCVHEVEYHEFRYNRLYWSLTTNPDRRILGINLV